jgi:hypothetical protein
VSQARLAAPGSGSLEFRCSLLTHQETAFLLGGYKYPEHASLSQESQPPVFRTDKFHRAHVCKPVQMCTFIVRRTLAAAVLQYSRNIFAIKTLRNYCVHISALQKYCKILRRDNIAPGCNIVVILLHTAIIV